MSCYLKEEEILKNKDQEQDKDEDKNKNKEQDYLDDKDKDKEENKQENCWLIALPSEIILNCICPHLEPLDMLKLCHTCNYFSQLLRTANSVWKSAVFRKWPFLTEDCIKYNLSSWFEACVTMMREIKKIHLRIKCMNQKYYWRFKQLSVDDYAAFEKQCRDHGEMVRRCIMDSLKKICESDVTIPTFTPNNGIYTLTCQHYAELVYDYLFHLDLENELFSFANNEYGIPEKVVEYYEMWMSPRTKFPVLDVFNKICAEAISKVLVILDHKQLLIKKKMAENDWDNMLLQDNAWPPKDCEAILVAAAKVFREMPFRDMTCRRESEIPDQKLYVIIYCTIVRRLGVRCDLKEPHNKLLIYWKPHWIIDDETLENVIYSIDPETGTKSVSRGCPYRGTTPILQKPYSPVAFLHALASTERPPDDSTLFNLGLFRNTELLHYLHPDVNDYLYILGKMYLVMQKDFSLIKEKIEHKLLSERNQQSIHMFISLLQEFKQKELYVRDYLIPKKKVVKHRTECLKFSIGMICYHKEYEYFCVIRGWDYCCEASTAWQTQMNVDRLQDKTQQPFYDVISMDGTSRYVAQENLVFQPVTFRLDVIEKHIKPEFSHFNGTCYIPNREKKSEYPEDIAFMIAAYQNQNKD